MKVQTTVLLLCFLSGVFLSSVVHSKPSPALMKELIALEKYLEKKQGSDGGDGQNKNQDEKPNDDNGFDNLFNDEGQKNEQIEPTNNGQDNNNNVGGEANNVGQEAPHENPKPDVPNEKPDGKPEEGVTHENTVDGPVTSGGEEDGEKPQEGNGPNQSGGQVDKGRDQIFTDLAQAKEKIKAGLNILDTLNDEIETQLQNDDRKVNELESNDNQRKEKTKEKIVQLTSAVEDIKDALGVRSAEKKSVKENAPARRSHLSDTEFLNKVHSLLTDN